MKIESQSSRSSGETFRPTPKAMWTFFIVFSLIPFVLRLGIEGRATQHQAFAAIYRDFRWSPGLRNLPEGSEILWERSREKDIYQDFFKNELQKDFKIVEVGSVPRVRAFFEESAYLRARFEVFGPGVSSGPIVFLRELRMTNNGILLGLWFGILLYLIGRSLTFSLSTAIVLTLFWFSHWNFLSLPREIWDFLQTLFIEVDLRIRQNLIWKPWDYGRALEVIALLWTLTVGVAFAFSTKLRNFYRKNFRSTLLASLVWEPFFLWVSSVFANWSGDAQWWKVYFGSFAFRFLLLGAVFFGFLQKDFWDIRKKLQLSTLGFRYSPQGLLFPLVFLLCGGWYWINSLFPLDSGTTLLRLKAFLVSFLVSFFMGSRLLSLGVSVLVISLHLPPVKGHWETAHIFGFLFDAALLGHLLSPAKGFHPVFPPLASSHRSFINVIIMAYVLGVFLTAVGVPFMVSWVAILLALWAYHQIAHPNPRLVGNEGAA